MIFHPFEVVPQRHLVSSGAYPGVEHRWLCDGRLLLLEHQKSPGAFQLFQDHWLRGQPVVIANSGKLHSVLCHCSELLF